MRRTLPASRCWRCSPRRRRPRSTHRAFAGSGRSRPPEGSRRSSRTGRCTSTPQSGSSTCGSSTRAGGRFRGARTASGATERLQAAQVLNAGTQGGAAVALLDFGPERVVRERIQLDVPPEPFVGRAEVEGSDDRRTFTRLSSTAIYDVRGAKRAVSTAVVFPPSDFRYYRIRATGVNEIKVRPRRRWRPTGAPRAAAGGHRRDPGGEANGDRRRRGVSRAPGARAPLQRRRLLHSTVPSRSTARWTARRTSSPAAAVCTASARPARRRFRSTAATATCGSGSRTGTTSRSATCG